MRPLLKWNRSAGLSVIEILVAIALFSMALAANLYFFSQTNRTIKQQSYQETRVRLFQGLIYMMGMPATLRGSLRDPSPEAAILKSAIQNGLGAVPSAPLPITLYLPVVTGDATTIHTSGPISGPTNAPLRYSLEGKICVQSSTPGGAAGTNACDPAIYPISVSTTFMPVCPPRYDYYNGVWSGPIYPNGLVIPNSCNRAQFIKIKYRFETTPYAPTDLYFDPVEGSVMVSAILANVGV